jgi:hypothetical protein
MATNGLEFFYFYSREAQTILQPFTLHAMVWLATAVFSVLGLITLGLLARNTREDGIRWSLLAAILGASITLTVLGVLFLPDLIPFWWIGTAAVGICWLGFGSSIVRIIGDRLLLLKAFFASLLAIGAILEIWSLGHWLYAGVAPGTTLGKVGADLEMNLAYANSWMFPALFLAAWLSPIWTYIAFQAFRKAKKNEPRVLRNPNAPTTPRLKLGLEDLILVLALALICVLVGFYAYLHDPPWLVGTDAYWRYSDPLERVASSGSSNALSTAANERHGLYLLLLYGVDLLTGLSPFGIVKASPIILAALLSIVTYFGVTSLRRSRTEGSIAGLLAAASLPATLGIFASIHANWLALSVAAVIIFALVSLGQSSKNVVPKAALIAFCGMFLLVLHPWTWGVIAVCVLVASAIFLTKRNWKMFAASWIVLLSGLVSGALTFALGSETERWKLMDTIKIFTLHLAERPVVFSPIDMLDHALKVWAPFLNPLLMILVLLGVLGVVRERSSSYSVFLLSWMAIAGAGSLLPVSVEAEIWRIWYVQPLWLLAGAGVSSLLGTRDLTKHATVHYSAIARTAMTICIAGVAVFLLQPVLGSSIFYLAALSPILFSLGRRRASMNTVFATTLFLFVSVFVLNHALRSLYPLVLEPHNFRER